MSSRPTYAVCVLSTTKPAPGLAAYFKVRPTGRTEALTSALRRIRKDTGLDALAHHAYGYERNAAGSTTIYYNVTLGRDDAPVTSARVAIGDLV